MLVNIRNRKRLKLFKGLVSNIARNAVGHAVVDLRHGKGGGGGDQNENGDLNENIEDFSFVHVPLANDKVDRVTNADRHVDRDRNREKSEQGRKQNKKMIGL